MRPTVGEYTANNIRNYSESKKNAGLVPIADSLDELLLTRTDDSIIMLDCGLLRDVAP